MAADLRVYWGEPEDSSMDTVFPIRFYGDGADTIGLNAFELMTMIAVAPNHSSSLKTRIVFLEDVLLSKVFFPNNVHLGEKHTQNAGKKPVLLFSKPRLSLRNTSYTSDSDRVKLLNILVWSFRALSFFDRDGVHFDSYRFSK